MKKSILLLIMILISGCSATKKVNEYVINKNTKIMHKKTCVYIINCKNCEIAELTIEETKEYKNCEKCHPQRMEKY